MPPSRPHHLGHYRPPLPPPPSLAHAAAVASLLARLAVCLVALAALGRAGPQDSEQCARKEHPRSGLADISPWLHNFTFSGAVNFSQIAFDPSRGQLIVGARNYLFRLSMSNLSLIQATEWSCTDTTKGSCFSKGKSEEECHNYVRVLLVRASRLFSCGTNAFSPICTERTLGNMNRVLDTINGVARCPYDPRQSSATLLTARGELYAATAVDFAGRDPALYRSLGGQPTLRTAQYNSRWLNEPNFVLAWEAGGFVYVAFRELAVEQECGRRVVSRVARVCANDLGGRFLLEDTWTTYMKARLDCSGSSSGTASSGAGGAGAAAGSGSSGSRRGNAAPEYPELRSAVYLPEAGLLYGLFSTSGSGPQASAVCAYNISSIAEAFNGPFKYQEGPRAAWMVHPNPNPNFQCGRVSEGPNVNLTERSLADAQRLLLMSEAVAPLGGRPVVAQPGVRLSHVAAHSMAAAQASSSGRTAVQHILYLATERGTVQKVAAATGCVIDEMELLPAVQQQPIRALRVDPGGEALFVGVDGGVLRLPLERCSTHGTESACLRARDPYCGWDGILRSCIRFRENWDGRRSWRQDVTSCPVRNLTVDGGPGPWSAWEPCQHWDGDVGGASAGGSSTGGGSSCQCRRRACDSPVPGCGGRPCPGPSVQVANCSRNGGWTPWSTWSGCSASCGMGFQARQRSCSNPSPRHGGRVCVGQSREERTHKQTKRQYYWFCNERARCPVPASWAPWGPWEPCSAPCGGGTRTRRRTCTADDAGDTACTGCDAEHEACSLDPCPETRRSTPWTPWVPVASGSGGSGGGNASARGRHEQRFRYTCRARLAEPGGLDASRRKVEMRFCAAATAGTAGGADECSIEGDVGLRAGGAAAASTTWSPWAAWSQCSHRCGRGFRSRRRLCGAAMMTGQQQQQSQQQQSQQQQQQCPGTPTEFQECNLQACPVDGGWSCWISWSACSATCGGGHRQRSRACTHPPPAHGGDICLGLHTEEALCNTQSCPDGWSEWSTWSECGVSGGRRFRSRLCTAPFPDVRRCPGNSTEERGCPLHPNAIEIPVNVAYSTKEDKRKCGEFSLAHVVAAGLTCGLLGCLLALLLVSWRRRCCYCCGGDAAARAGGASRGATLALARLPRGPPQPTGLLAGTLRAPGGQGPAPLNPGLSPALSGLNTSKLDKYDSLEAIKVLNKNYLMNEENAKCINSHIHTTKTFANTLYSDLKKYDDY
ncbi:semaphorin-5A-like isoform X1 [Lampetra fluviatilis]